MSLTSALNTAVASLKVNQTAIQLLSSNVAHANDPNYTKKTLATQTLYNGPDQPGGVVVAGYSSAVNEAMRKQYEALTAQDSTTSTASDYLAQVQNILGSSSDSASLPSLLSDFTAAWQQYQANPDSATAQQQVISLGQRFAGSVNDAASQIDQLDLQVRNDTDTSVKNLNDLLEQVYNVNVQLKGTNPSDAGYGDLIDQRDALVRQVAQLVDVRTIERGDGTVSLFTTGGMSLLDGAPRKFSFDGNNVIDVESNQAVSSQIRDGKLRAQLDFRMDNSSLNQPASSNPATEVIRKLKSQLDLIASAFTATAGNPATFAGAYNNATASQRVVSTFATTVKAGATTAQSSTISLSGTLQQGDVFAVTVNGKTYSYTATASDTSLDQIASQLSAKINADTTLGVTAVPGVGSLQLQSSNNNVPFDVSTTVNGQIPELTSGFFSGTDRYTFSINASLLDGSQQLKRNAASDVVNSLNNSSRNFVATGLSVTNVSYSGLVSNVIGTASTNAKTVSDQAKLNTDTLTMTQQQYQSATGVNLDEEIANLQVLQNAYSASARLLTVIQTMFDTLQQAVSH
ncbi:MAG TPA: flagellar hook-associated protein FlgK [Dongiaceae bacterium]|nr:flagellar hook-associated protein FlgK [Dongiaceae bacterium]